MEQVDQVEQAAEVEQGGRWTGTRSRFLRAGALGLGAAAGALAPAASSPAGAAPPRGGDASALSVLRARLRGPLLLPGDPEYEARSRPANGRYLSIRPIAVAQCADERDVVTCVRWAREFGVPPVARGGGHSYAGFSTTTGLIVDLGRLNSVTIDRTRGTAVVGGAALNGDVFDATADRSWFL
ncbi:MAG TPA: FAD-dependent oxidoreductase, partial [Chloroflexota bacterium]|nr:FAD-dependent oxidoreductase [Chloroflexota bacterium]